MLGTKFTAATDRQELQAAAVVAVAGAVGSGRTVGSVGNHRAEYSPVAAVVEEDIEAVRNHLQHHRMASPKLLPLRNLYHQS